MGERGEDRDIDIDRNKREDRRHCDETKVSRGNGGLQDSGFREQDRRVRFNTQSSVLICARILRAEVKNPSTFDICSNNTLSQFS